MANRIVTTLVLASLLGLQAAPAARAENQMGYSLLSVEAAKQLPRGGGVLGVDVARAQQITDSAMTFDLLRVKSVRRGSPGEQAGLKTGDQIIAVDGKVFPSVAAFASYVGSGKPGTAISLDFMPSSGGPKEAQRVSVVLGGRTSAPARTTQAPAAGLSTGTKLAIGVGAAALFGCYELGCFSHRKSAPIRAGQPQPAAVQ